MSIRLNGFPRISDVDFDWAVSMTELGDEAAEDELKTTGSGMVAATSLIKSVSRLFFSFWTAVFEFANVPVGFTRN